ncbi:hypothetical protein MKW92_031269 [Papaver armeniacum]|nr:hypothetical protein MKW92_031269 [Papaver armeniacum]
MFVEFETREMFKLMSWRTLPRCSRTALESIEKATKLYQGVAIVNKDEAYNRLGYTIVSKFTPNALDGSGAFRKAVVAVVKAAFDSIDFELHCGTHPRLGVFPGGWIIRRQLGYFKPNSEGNQWAGALGSDSLPLKPDEGPYQATPTKGVVVVGATQWIDNYNMPIFTNKITAVCRISRRVSGRGGGFPSVQAMALAHGHH